MKGRKIHRKTTTSKSLKRHPSDIVVTEPYFVLIIFSGNACIFERAWFYFSANVSSFGLFHDVCPFIEYFSNIYLFFLNFESLF